MPHSPTFLRVIRQRFHRLQGQLTGIKGMIYNDVEIVHILNQTHAAHRALTSIEALLLEQHLTNTTPTRLEIDKHRAVKELIAVFKRKIL
jgi:DNA-binding FrmR family transcriptional regulator